MESALTVALVAGPIALLALWLVFQHKPGWYRPPVLDEAGIRRAQRDAVSTADWVSDRMAEGKPFEVVLFDRSVNEWLAALPHVWPAAQHALPPELTEPVVHFVGRQLRDQGEVIVGVHYARGGWRAIVSARFSLGVSEDGTTIVISENGAYGGSLPIPRSLVENLLTKQPIRRWIGTLPLGADPRRGAPGPADARAGDGTPRAPGLLDGFEIANRFVWFNGERPYRIDSIEIEQGKLRLRIEPR